METIQFRLLFTCEHCSPNIQWDLQIWEIESLCAFLIHENNPIVLELLLTILDVHTLRCLIEHVCFPSAELMHVILGHCRWCASTRQRDTVHVNVDFTFITSSRLSEWSLCGFFLLIEVDRSHYSVQDCVLLLTSFEMCLSRILLCLDGKIMFLWLRNDYSSQFRGCVGETLVLLLTVVSLCVSPQKQTVLRKRCKEKFPYSMTLHRNVRSFGANNQVQGWEKQVFITQPIWQVQREVNRNSENHRWDSSTPYSHPYSGVCGIDVNLKLVCCVSQCLLTEACMKLICVSLYELVKFLWESVHQHFTILFKKTVGRYTNSEILQPTVIKVIVFKIKKKIKVLCIHLITPGFDDNVVLNHTTEKFLWQHTISKNVKHFLGRCFCLN